MLAKHTSSILIMSLTVALLGGCQFPGETGPSNPQPTTYTLTVQSGGNGTTIPSGPQNVNSGAATNITATPAAGYAFSSWTVMSGTASIANVSSASTTVTLNTGNATVQANFAAAGILSIKSISTPSGVVKATDTWQLSATIGNDGLAATTAASLYYYLSRDATLDVGDALIGGAARTIPAINPGAQYTDVYSSVFEVSDVWTNFGTQYVLVKTVDADGVTAISSAQVKVAYDNLQLDAYDPAGINMNGGNRLILDLIDPSGNVVASDGELGIGNNTDPDQNGWPQIDSTGVAPGTWYMRIRPFNPPNSDPTPYAIRALLVPSSTHSGMYPGAVQNNVDPYETTPYDETIGTNGLPVNPVVLQIGVPLSRYLATDQSDVDWVVITLP